MSDLADTPPHLVASLAISAGVAALFVANLFIALGLPTGTAGNVRLLQFLSAADVAVGAVLVLAVALIALAPPPPLAAIEPTIPGPATAGAAARPDTFRLVAGFVSVAVAAGGLVRAIVVLTIADQRGAVKVGNMIDALAAVAVAAVAAYWALRPK
ncbi:MAG: hypothetical protein QOF30_305 [Acidimicrobiaceae bacterium]|jgi:hypothetical protein|nr:hypothetical protein [Acidimicrobiaceae bacterium]